MITGYGLGKSLTWFLQPFSEIMSRGVLSQFHILILGLWLSIGVWAETPRYKMNYLQYEATVRAAVAHLPELAKLFNDAPKMHYPANSVYLGGGILRGLLKWIDGEILKREKPGSNSLLHDIHYSQVQVPSIESLVQRGADRDLWVSNHFRHAAINVFGFRDWDLLPPEFYEASLKAGGAALEKLKVNTNEVVDPLNALKDWYHGEISFHLPTPEEFERTKKVLKGENTQTALALRFLRFVVENPELNVSQASWEALAKLAEREQRLPNYNWWIAKGLAKLFRASNGNVPQILGLLERSGLLKNLLANGYTLRSTDRFDESYVPRLENFYEAVRKMPHVSFDDRRRFFHFVGLVLSPSDMPTHTLLGRTEEEILNTLRRTKTLAEFLKHTGIGGAPNNYFLTWDKELQDKVREKITPHLEAMALRPDARSASSLMERVVGAETWQAALKSGESKVKALLLAGLKKEEGAEQVVKSIGSLLLVDSDSKDYSHALFHHFPGGEGLEEMIAVSKDFDTFNRMFGLKDDVPPTEIQDKLRPHLNALAKLSGGGPIAEPMTVDLGPEWKKLHLTALGSFDKLRRVLSSDADSKTKSDLIDTIVKIIGHPRVSVLLSLFEQHPEDFRQFIKHTSDLSDFASIFGLYESRVLNQTLREKVTGLLRPHFDLLAQKYDALKKTGAGWDSLRFFVDPEEWIKAVEDAKHKLREFFATSQDFSEKAHTLDHILGKHTPRNYLLYDLFFGREKDFARFLAAASTIDEVVRLFGFEKESPHFWNSQFGEFIKFRLFERHLAALATKPDAVSDHKIMHHLMGAEKWQRAVEDVRKTGGADCASHLTQIAAGR